MVVGREGKERGVGMDVEESGQVALIWMQERLRGRVNGGMEG